MFTIFDKAAEMATTGWDKRLKIAYRDGVVSSVSETVDESQLGPFDRDNPYPTVTEICGKYLASDYT